MLDNVGLLRYKITRFLQVDQRREANRSLHDPFSRPDEEEDEEEEY